MSCKDHCLIGSSSHPVADTIYSHSTWKNLCRGNIRSIKAHFDKIDLMWTSFNFKDLDGLQLDIIFYIDAFIDVSFDKNIYKLVLLFRR